MSIHMLTSMKDRLICMLYHKNIPSENAELMEKIRQEYVNLGMFMVKVLPEDTNAQKRSKALAFTHLEESLMRSIQSLAFTGEPDVTLYEGKGGDASSWVTHFGV